jgi:Methyltransferase small domain
MDLFFFLSILLCLCLLAILLSIVGYSLYHGITPMPTSRKTKNCLLLALPKTIKAGKIYELGAGWGTLAFPLAAHYPQNQVVAFENSPVPYLFSKGRALIDSHSNLAILKRNFFSISLEDAALVVCYLYPLAMTNLKEKFKKELKPGTWIISNTFAIPGWKPENIYQVPDIYRTKIYLYIIR